MAKLVKGDVVVVPFPFSDLSQSKRRPALVISKLEGNDVMSIKDNYAIPLDDKNFVAGGLKQSSNIRPNRIFTADSNIVLYKAGDLTKEKVSEILERLIEIIRK